MFIVVDWRSPFFSDQHRVELPDTRQDLVLRRCASPPCFTFILSIRRRPPALPCRAPALPTLCDKVPGLSIHGVPPHATRVDLAGRRLRPADASLLYRALETSAGSMAGVTWLDLVGNTLGEEGAACLVRAFDDRPHIRTLCGVEEGTEELDLSNRAMDASSFTLLAHELKDGSRAAAKVTSLDKDCQPQSPRCCGDNAAPRPERQQHRRIDSVFRAHPVDCR